MTKTMKTTAAPAETGVVAADTAACAAVDSYWHQTCTALHLLSCNVNNGFIHVCDILQILHDTGHLDNLM